MSQRPESPTHASNACTHTQSVASDSQRPTGNGTHQKAPKRLSENGVEEVDDSLTLCRRADKTLVVLGEGYHGGSHASTLEGFDDPSLLFLHDRNA